MPLHRIPTSRRRFLQTSISAGVLTLNVRPAAAARRIDPHFWALLADTHVAADAETVARGVNMVNNLNRIVGEVLAEDPLPAGAIINGDCAYLKGLDGDYATLKPAIERLVDGGVPVHMTMGNHDDREKFHAAFASHNDSESLVDGKHVANLQAERANLFLVDSLNEVNVVTGQLGNRQLEWLRKALREHDRKPAIVIGHHNPQLVREESKAPISGLADTAAFLETLHSMSHVQAYVFGHTHNWHVSRTAKQLHLINQPPCAYLFDETRPNGWVRLVLGHDQFSVQLRALDALHPQHGELHTFAYQA